MTSPSVDAVPDVRLVPSALTGWAVTAAGIVWGAAAAVVVQLGDCGLRCDTGAVSVPRPRLEEDDGEGDCVSCDPSWVAA